MRRNEFQALLEAVQLAAWRFDRKIENVIKLTWWDGRVLVKTTLDSELWAADECRYCYIGEFLKTEAYLPWLVTLKYLGYEQPYKYTLKYLETYGDEVEALNIWATELVKGAKELT